jgi:hypothetical protein
LASCKGFKLCDAMANAPPHTTVMAAAYNTM